jgi:hypothetical protein
MTEKVKEKLSLRLINYRAMKTCGSEGIAPLFLTSEVDVNGYICAPGAFTSGGGGSHQCKLYVFHKHQITGYGPKI